MWITILKFVAYGWISVSAITILWFFWEIKHAPEMPECECEALLSEDEKSSRVRDRSVDSDNRSVDVDAKLEGLLMDVTSAFIESDGLYWQTWVDRIKSICGLDAQDEPERTMVFRGGNDGGGNDSCGDTGVDAIMGKLREALRDKMLEYHTDYVDHEEWQSDDCPENIHEYGNATEVEEFSTDISNTIEKIVRPIIERLVGEIRLKNIFLRGKEGCEQEMVKAIEAKELAEAEVARLRGYLDSIVQALQYEGSFVRERAEVLEIIGKYETQ